MSRKDHVSAILFVAVLAFGGSAVARADVVICTDNSRHEGKVVERGDFVIVKTKTGVVKLERAKVADILRTETSLSYRFRANLKARDLLILASRAGITLRYDDRNVGKDRRRRDRLIEAVSAAVAFYHELLLSGSEAGTARRYLRTRGFDGDAARSFSLGWAPEDWERLSMHLQSDGFSRDDLVETGLAFVNRANRLQDQFRARLLFPIFDREGHPVGFGGRSLTDEGPKYKNTAETSIYHKSRLLYGLHRAKAEIVSRDEVIVCEGYTDVMAFHLAGATHAVATCGTALTDDHFNILKNLSRNIVLAYDADAAGQAAAEKCYRWERDLDVQFRVANLPAGQDPADVWQEDPEALLGAIGEAMPLLQFRIDRRLADVDTTTLESRARSAESVAQLVAEHPNELVRDQYAVKLAERLDIDANQLRVTIARAQSGARRVPSPPARAAAPTPAPAADRVQLEALRWAVHEPTLVASLLSEQLFRTDVARAAYRSLARASTFDEAVQAADGETRSLLLRLAVEEPTMPPGWDDEEEADVGGDTSAGVATSRISDLKEIAREHAPERIDLSRIPRRIAVEVVARLAEDRARRLLTRLSRDNHDRAIEMKQSVKELEGALERDDVEAGQRATERLVALVVTEEST